MIIFLKCVGYTLLVIMGLMVFGFIEFVYISKEMSLTSVLAMPCGVLIFGIVYNVQQGGMDIVGDYRRKHAAICKKR